MVKTVLELFSGTHSIGKVAKKKGWFVVSVDRDLNDECPFNTGYKSPYHINADIMNWDYKKDFNIGDFDIITASPVCKWWSVLRNCCINRKLKGMDRPLTKEDIENDINTYGKPMVDKVREIIDYFKPKYYWIENPQTGKMKTYILDLPYYDVDYCKYGFDYKKRTRIWTNINNFKSKKCNKKKHKVQLGHCKKSNWDGSQTLERYRIPDKLIEDLFICISSQ